MSVLPMAVYGLEVPAGDVAIPAKPDIPAAFRITMAAIDPSAEAEESSLAKGAKPRATLKIIREPLLSGMNGYDDYDDSDDSDFDEDEMNALLAEEGDEDSSEEDDDEDAEGGPSDPAKSKKARRQAAADQIRKLISDEMELDETNGVNGKGKGKGKGKTVATEDDDDEDEDDEEDSDDDSIDEPEEFVICTLDPEKAYQQTLDITIGEDERVWFKVSGTHTIYLTGNYVEPADPHSHDHEYDDEYDSEDEDDDEEDGVYPVGFEEIDEDEMSEDDLDDLEDPRITEVADDEEAPALVPAAAEKKSKKAEKGKNKRAAEDSVDASLDDLISKAQSSEAAASTNGDAKLSKKQAKKLKNNEGKAVAAEAEKPGSAKSDKKVQFAEKLEQGPTPSPSASKASKANGDKAKAAAGPRTVQGVTVDDKKIGTGPAAKKGDRIGMRYIGKLKDGKVFDSNKKGKPFSFKLGAGEVIRGWDIGIAGMTAGGERRITVPAHLAYGSKSMAGIPANSQLIFDVKCVEIK